MPPTSQCVLIWDVTARYIEGRFLALLVHCNELKVNKENGGDSKAMKRSKNNLRWSEMNRIKLKVIM